MNVWLEWLCLAACRRSWRVYQHLSFAATKVVGSSSVRIPIRSGMGLSNIPNLQVSQPELTHAVKECARRGYQGCFVDIGANTGQSLLAFLAANVPGSYLGFEPDIEAAAYVAELLRRNPVIEGQILATALGASAGCTVMHTAARGYVGATINPAMTPHTMYHRMSRVTRATGDSHLAHLPRDGILLIKIDVEGAELAVLQGLKETLRLTGAPLYVEVLGVDHFLDGSYSREYFGEIGKEELAQIVRARRSNAGLVEEFLKECGYDLFMITEAALTSIQRIDVDEPRPGYQGERNVLALARKRVVSMKGARS